MLNVLNYTKLTSPFAKLILDDSLTWQASSRC